MKWEGQEQSNNVEDRRGQGGSSMGGGGGGGFRIGGGGLGIGGILIALVAGWIFGINPLTLLGVFGGGGPGVEVVQQQPRPQVVPQGQAGQPGQPGQRGPAGQVAAQDRAAAFVSTVLRDTEIVWGRVFQAGGKTYEQPKLVLFRGATRSGCGMGESSMGPFYCPADQKVYLDLDFFDTLSRNLGAPGDFAQAYVVAHEVAHHVQRVLGITEKVEERRSRAGRQLSNAISVRLELQADCLAGVWAHHSQKGKGWLDQGDIEEAINAAAKIGDDTLQRRSQGTVVPESFTHGSSAQRVQWFKKGMQTGNMNACNTFDDVPGTN